MSRVVLLGDTHFHYSRANPVFHRYFEKFYKFLFSYMSEQEIKHLIQLGDLFDNRREIHFSSIKEVNEYFFAPIKEHGIAAYVISGNHDVLYKNTSEINSISLLCPDYITVIDKEPKTLMIGKATFDLYPWINESNYTQSLDKAKKVSGSDYCVGHFEFSGFPMYPGSVADHGMSHSDFSRYREVFSGHYHTISMRDNVTYTGTPYELNWSDCNDPKGFWVLDTNTGKKEFVPNPYKIYEKISYTDSLEYDFSSSADKYVKVIVVGKESQKKLDQFVDALNASNPISVTVSDFTTHSDIESVDLTDVVSTRDMITSVIDSIATPLDKDTLKRYMLATYTEAMNLSKE